MVTEPKDSWQQVGDQLSGLGLKLKLHYEQAAKDGQPVDESPIKEALQKLTAAVEQTFGALGNAASDDAVRQDARDVGLSLRDALESSFSKLGEQFRSSNKKD